MKRALAFALALSLLLLCIPSHHAVASGRAVNGVQLGAGGGPIGTNLFVSATGAGSSCTALAPCTIATAHAALIGRGTGTINLLDSGGPYRLASPIALTSPDSGLTIQNAPGAVPVLMGSVQPGTFAAYSGGIQKASVAAGASNRQLWTQAAGSSVWNRRIRAQALASTLGSWTINSTGFAGTSTLGALPDKLDLEIRGQAEWLDFRCPLSGVTNSQLTGSPHCWGLWDGGTAGGPTPTVLGTIENSLSFLNTPGFFYFDVNGYNGAANELYYEPATSDGTLSAADVEVPVLSQLITLNGCSNCAVIGLTLYFDSWQPLAGDGVTAIQGGYVYQTVGSTTGALWPYTTGGASMIAQVTPAAITATNSPNVTISGNVLSHLGSGAISIQGTTTGTVSGNTGVDISGGGVVIGSSMMTSDETAGVANVTVTNNVFQNVGQDYWTSPAIQAGYVSHVTISQNDLDFSSYDGVMVGGFEQTSTFSSYGQDAVTNNRIYNAMHRLLTDGGGVYFTGNQASGLSSTITGNVINGVAQGPQAIVYWDTWTSYMVATGNVVQDSSTITCLLYIQIGISPGTHNTWGTNYSNDSAGCNPGTWDASNSFTTPTALSPTGTIYDQPTILATAGSTLRGSNKLFGASVAVSGGSTGSQLVDGKTNLFTNGWVCNATPCTATITLASATTLREVDVAYNYGNSTVSQASGYSIKVSANCSSYVTVGSVDTAGSFQSGAGIWYSGVEPVTFTPQTVQCIQLTSSTNVLAFSEVEGR